MKRRGGRRKLGGGISKSDGIKSTLNRFIYFNGLESCAAAACCCWWICFGVT